MRPLASVCSKNFRTDCPPRVRCSGSDQLASRRIFDQPSRRVPPPATGVEADGPAVGQCVEATVVGVGESAPFGAGYFTRDALSTWEVIRDAAETDQAQALLGGRTLADSALGGAPQPPSALPKCGCIARLTRP
jgi:hypothetical protein